jgi:hypothetical protein
MKNYLACRSHIFLVRVQAEWYGIRDQYVCNQTVVQTRATLRSELNLTDLAMTNFLQKLSQLSALVCN